MCREHVSCDDASDNYDEIGDDCRDYDHAGVVTMAEKQDEGLDTGCITVQ